MNVFVKKVSSELRDKKRDIRFMIKTVSILQYIIVSFISVIILQIILQRQYSSFLVIFVTIISYVPAAIILGILSYRFIEWYKIRKNSITFASCCFPVGKKSASSRKMVDILGDTV
jgi:peptidoglycan/LPS O-acetylase OafA/YrhL